MSPQIALFAYFVILITLFYVDLSNKKNLSVAVWISLLWYIVIGTKPVVQWINPNLLSESGSAQSVQAGSAIDRIVLSLIILFGIIIIIKRKELAAAIFRNNTRVFVLFLFCFLSIFWSDYPVVTFKRIFRGLGGFIIILVILTEKSPVEAIKSVILRCAYITVPLSLVFIKYFREYGVIWGHYDGLPMFVGVTGHKNTLGRLCLICGLAILWDIYDKIANWKDLNFKIKRQVLANGVVLLTIIHLLSISKSTTAQFCFYAGLALFIILGLSFIRRSIKYIAFLCLFGIVAFLFAEYVFNISEVIIHSLGKDVTLTGRTDLWRELLTFDINPIVGTGYGSFWIGDRLQTLWNTHWWLPTEAHNGLLEIYLNLGLVGLLIWLAVVSKLFFTIINNLNIEYSIGRLQFVIFVIFLLYNITEAAVNLHAFMVFNFFLLCMLPVKNTKISSNQPAS